MYRHVLSLIGSEPTLQEVWEETAQRLHSALLRLTPPGAEPGVDGGAKRLTTVSESVALVQQFADEVGERHGRQQVVVYYLGHGHANGAIFQVEGSERIPLADLLAPLWKLQARGRDIEALIILDACASGDVFVHPVVPETPVSVQIIAACKPTGKAWWDPATRRPALSDNLAALLEAGLPGKPESLGWGDILPDLQARLTRANAALGAQDIYERRLNPRGGIALNALYERETLERYLQHLCEHARQLPGFMGNALSARGRSAPDVLRLMQPITLTRGLDGPPSAAAKPEVTRDRPAGEAGPGQPQPSAPPRANSDGPPETASRTVVQAYWDPKLLEEDRLLMVVGEPGSGKSWIARDAVLHYAGPLLNEDGTLGCPAAAAMRALPMVLRLERLRGREGSALTVREFVQAAVRPEGERFDNLLAAVMEDRESGVLIVDGLDEVADSLAAETLNLLGELGPVDRFSRRMLICCRRQRYISLRSYLQFASPPSVVSLLALDPVSVRRFSEVFLGPELARTARAAIDRAAVNGLISNPLYLTMACIALLDGEGGSQPAEFQTRAELLRRATRALLKSWPVWRRGAQPGDRLDRPVEGAYRSYALYSAHTLLEEDGLAEDARQAICSGNEWDAPGLLVGDGEGPSGFAHRSIAEFFAAEGLLALANERKQNAADIVDTLAWQPRHEEVVVDLLCLLEDPLPALERLAEPRRDSSSRHRLRLAGRAVAALRGRDDARTVELLTRVSASILGIYLFHIEPSRGLFDDRLLPAPGSEAASWEPAVQAVIRADPRVFATVIDDACDLEPDPLRMTRALDVYLRPRMSGPITPLVAEMARRLAHRPLFNTGEQAEQSREESARRKADDRARKVARSVVCLLMTEPAALACYPAETLGVLTLVAAEGARGYFDGYWRLLRGESLRAVAEEFPQEVATAVCRSEVGWRFFENFSQSGSPRLAAQLGERLSRSIDTGEADVTSTSYALKWLAEVGLAEEVMPETTVSRIERALAGHYVPSWSDIERSDESRNRAYEINGLQAVLARQPQMDPAGDLHLRLLTHRDFRIRATAGAALRRSKGAWAERRSDYAFAALDRLRFHRDLWDNLHFGQVAPRKDRDWTPDSVTGPKSATEELAQDVLWAHLAAAAEQSWRCLVADAGELELPKVPTAWIRFAPDKRHERGRDLIEATLAETFSDVAANCPRTFLPEVTAIDPAVMAPLIYSAFYDQDVGLAVNAALAIGTLFGPRSPLFEASVVRCLSLGADKSAHDRENKLQQCADAINWFTPMALPEPLRACQQAYDEVKRQLAGQIASTALEAGVSNAITWASLCQLPLAGELQFDVAYHACTESADARYAFPTLLAGALGRAFQGGHGGEREFLALRDMALSASGESFGRSDYVPLIEGISRHPRAPEFARNWWERLRPRVGWNRETKLFVLFISAVGEGTVNSYPEAWGVIEREMKQPAIVKARRRLDALLRKEFYAEAQLDTRVVVAAIRSGRSISGWKRLHVNPPDLGATWIYSPATEEMRACEDMGWRFLPMDKRGGAALRVVRTVDALVPFVAMAWIWRAGLTDRHKLEALFPMPASRLGVVLGMLLWGPLTSRLAPRARVRVSHADRLCSRRIVGDRPRTTRG